jgi:hypothetical protein
VRRFANAERKGGCYPGIGAWRVAGQLGVFGYAMDTVLRPGPDRSRCSAAKLKATGKQVGKLLASFAKAMKKARRAELGKLLTAMAGTLSRTFARAERKGDCLTAGDTDATLAHVHAFAGALLLDVDGCTPVTAEAFEAQAPGLWGTTLAHARDLGYDVVRDATLCPGLGAGAPTRAAAVLVDPTATAPDDTLELLFFADPRPFAILLRMDSEQVPTLFNQGGGVRMPADGPPELVGPDGRTPASVTLVSGDATGNSCARREELYRACLIASDVLNVVACANAVVAAASTYGTFTTVAAIICTQSLLPGPIGFGCDGFWNEMKVCDRGSKCSSRDECSWGACRPAEPASVGTSCAEEQAGNLPLCLPEDPQAIVRALCTPGGVCGSRFDRCPDGQVCAGAPAAASCTEPPLSTTTTSTTTTTLPTGCEFQCGDGSCIVASIVCNGIPDCPGGGDEDVNICSNTSNCCVATLGCPGETGSSCAASCCCCPGGQACCPNPVDGCCAAP